MNEMSWHATDADAALKALETDPHEGLTTEVAQKRLEKYGYNELKQQESICPFTILFNQFKNILIFAMALSALVGELVDAAIILVIVICCAVLRFIQEYRAERAMEALKKMLSPTITALR